MSQSVASHSSLKVEEIEMMNCCCCSRRNEYSVESVELASSLEIDSSLQMSSRDL